MKKLGLKSFYLSAACIGALSLSAPLAGCGTMNGAGVDMQNWGTFLEERFGEEEAETAARLEQRAAEQTATVNRAPVSEPFVTNSPFERSPANGGLNNVQTAAPNASLDARPIGEPVPLTGNAPTASDSIAWNSARPDMNNNMANNTAANTDSRITASAGCPPITMPPALSQITDFASTGDTSASNMVSSASITNAKTTCNKGASFVTVALDLTVTAITGPKARRASSDKPYFSFPYYIAVTDANGTELAREVFAVPFSFSAGENTKTAIETIEQNLPLSATGILPDFRVEVGFQLTDDQIAFNKGM